MIRLRVTTSDGVLKRHTLEALINAKCMLKTIKNKLICLCAEEIVTGIVSEYKESRVFSIFADEDRDEVPKLIRCQFWECESGTSGQELCLSTIVFTATKIRSIVEVDIPV